MDERIKLVVTDVDGTLVATHSQIVSKANLAVIANLEKSGCHVALATARPPEYCQHSLTNLQLKGLHVVDGGASVYDFSSKCYVWRQWLTVEQLQTISKAFLPFAKDFIDVYPGPVMVPLGDFSMDSITVSAPYAYTRCLPADWPEFEKNLALINDVYYSIVARESTIWHVQVCSHKGSKQHGVEQLQKLLSVTKAQTLAIGDNQNDEALFAAAGTKIAMGNATDELKARATYVTETVEEGGWANAVRKFVS
ncbi:MAG: HAD family hydrolase [Candidatus Saccharimonas sp.]